jgi:hypothetical protein
MTMRRMTMVVVLAGLGRAPMLVAAQGPGHPMGMRGGMEPDSGARMEMQGTTEMHKRMSERKAPQATLQPEKK